MRGSALDIRKQVVSIHFLRGVYHRQALTGGGRQRATRVVQIESNYICTSNDPSSSSATKMQKNNAARIAGIILAMATAFAIIYTLRTRSNSNPGDGISGNNAGRQLRASGEFIDEAGEEPNKTHRRLPRLSFYANPQTTTAKPVLREWPASDAPAIPAGDYGDFKRHPNPRVLLYVTTHFSEQHELFLRYCWKNVMARSPLLQGADIAVYLNPGDVKLRKEAMGVLSETFAENNLMVYVRDQVTRPKQDLSARPWQLKQIGAVRALWDAAESGYFNGYDWVIRVNPDVIIRDDSFLRENMYDPSISAMIINCHTKGSVHVMTDFFMVRPEALRYDLLKGKGAETAFTAALQENVLEKNKFLWIPGAEPKRNHCRAGYMREFYESPIIHEHALHPDICSVPEAEVLRVNSAFPEGWPRFWNKQNMSSKSG